MTVRIDILAFCLLGLVACGTPNDGGALATVDCTGFESTPAYNVLLRDCGFVECHGKAGRFLEIVGPGRTRTDTTAGIFEASPSEAMMTCRSARALIDAANPEKSDLLRKPLSPKVGGAGHKGVDAYGRDVFATTDDPDYQVLRSFVLGMPAQLPNWGADWEKMP